MEQKAILVVGLSTQPGNEAELAQWYRDVHIPEARPHMQGISRVALYMNLKPDKNSPCVLAVWEFDSFEAAKAVQTAIESQTQMGNSTPGPACEVRLLSFFRQFS